MIREDELFVKLIDEIVYVVEKIVPWVDVVKESLDALSGSFDVVADEVDSSFAKTDLFGQQLEFGNGAWSVLKMSCYFKYKQWFQNN